MKLIVGLGNAGPRYAGTRHNVGFEVVDLLASRWNLSLESEKFHGWFGLTTHEGERLVVLKPTTLMNRSGRSVLAAGRFYKLDINELLVVSDDLAMPPGRLRMRAGGSAGGHKGLQDIINSLGDDTWSRLRIGIGEPIGNPSVFVLNRFTFEEEELMHRAVQRAADAVACWIVHGVEKTMNRYNGESQNS